MYYPGFRYRQRSSAYFSYSDKSSSHLHLGSTATLSDTGSRGSLNRSSISRPELMSLFQARPRVGGERTFQRSRSAPATPVSRAPDFSGSNTVDSLLKNTVSRLSTPSGDEDHEGSDDERPVCRFAPSSLPNSPSFLDSPLTTPKSPRRARAHIYVDGVSQHSAVSAATSMESRPESLGDLPTCRATALSRRFGAVIGEASALRAVDLEEVEASPSQRTTGRRRSVTFQLDQLMPSARGSNASLTKISSKSPRRPSTLSLSNSPLLNRRRPSGPVDRSRSGSVVSSSSRSSGASTLYGKPPQPYAGDKLRFRRESVNSASDGSALPSPLRSNMFESKAEDGGVGASPAPPTDRSSYTRRKSIDHTFQWGVDLVPTTIDCCMISYTVLPRTLSLPARILRRAKQAMFTTPRDDLEALPAGDVDVTLNNKTSWPKQVLKGLTFRAETGSLVAVLGPTGSGKTTLLDVLAKRYNKSVCEVSGSVLFNGMRWSRNFVKRNVGYVLQHDCLLPSLTVRETLSYVGRLKLPPNTFTAEQVEKRVTSILTELGINEVREEQIGDGFSIRGLSGGERRRVSIAVQLMQAPSVLLLDEPTTGLDSFTASQLVYTLTKLTYQRHTIVMSIHQPRSDLFAMFHDVILLNDGELVWSGPAGRMLAHFEDIGYTCPVDANPLQFYLMQASINPHSTRDKQLTSERVKKLKKAYQECDYYRELCEELHVSSNTQTKSSFNRKRRQSIEQFKGNVGPSSVKKLQTLTRRAIANTLHNKSAVFARTFQLPLLAVFLFCFFTRLGNDQRSVSDRNGLILETLVEISLATAITVMNLCTPMRDLFDRESQEGMYGPTLFLLSYFLHSTPFSTISSLLWTCAIYFMIGLNLQVAKWFIYLAAVLLLHLLGECLAVFFLGLCSSVPMADSITTFVVMASIVLASGSYRVSASLPNWLDALSYLSPFRYCGAILQANEFSSLELDGCGGNSSHRSVADACLWQKGEAYLDVTLTQAQQNIGRNFAGLIGLLLVLYAATFAVFSLRQRLRHI